jgi:hypothetical protein
MPCLRNTDEQPDHRRRDVEDVQMRRLQDGDGVQRAAGEQGNLRGLLFAARMLVARTLTNGSPVLCV